MDVKSRNRQKTHANTRPSKVEGIQQTSYITVKLKASVWLARKKLQNLHFSLFLHFPTATVSFFGI